MTNLVNEQDTKKLQDIFSSGLSPNPCNGFSSLIHTVCRRGLVSVLQLMVQHGCRLQVSDASGRTPLHEACWGGHTEEAAIIVRQDPCLLQLQCARGLLPLDYVRAEQYEEWIQFLDEHKDQFWPRKCHDFDDEDDVPFLTTCAPSSRPLPDPKNALTLDLAGKVSSGRITGAHAVMIQQGLDELEEGSENSDWTSDGGCSSWEGSDSEGDDEDDFEFGDDMQHLLDDLMVLQGFEKPDGEEDSDEASDDESCSESSYRSDDEECEEGRGFM